MCPVIVNQVPAMKEVKGFFWNLLWQQLENILWFSKVYLVWHLLTLNVGLTIVQGSQWWVYQGVAMPGTIAIMDILPRPLLGWFAKGMRLLMDLLKKEAFTKPGHMGVKFFSFCHFQHIMLWYLSDALCLSATKIV